MQKTMKICLGVVGVLVLIGIANSGNLNSTTSTPSTPSNVVYTRTIYGADKYVENEYLYMTNYLALNNRYNLSWNCDLDLAVFIEPSYSDNVMWEEIVGQGMRNGYVILNTTLPENIHFTPKITTTAILPTGKNIQFQCVKM